MPVFVRHMNVIITLFNEQDPSYMLNTYKVNIILLYLLLGKQQVICPKYLRL